VARLTRTKLLVGRCGEGERDCEDSVCFAFAVRGLFGLPIFPPHGPLGDDLHPFTTLRSCGGDYESYPITPGALPGGCGPCKEVGVARLGRVWAAASGVAGPVGSGLENNLALPVQSQVLRLSSTAETSCVLRYLHNGARRVGKLLPA